ncbi:aldo/keto reductase [Streptosporangium album]|uniref:aldo/keto reductase n=1 Tax=Streptosporangium album TaxID=47479 RepID=UPI001FE5DAEB
MRQLGRDHLDVVNLRVLGTDSIAERFGAPAHLRDAGLIRHLGISNVHPEQLAEARAIAPVVCVQNQYGIGARPEQDAFLRTCGEQGIAFVPFYSIAGAGNPDHLVANVAAGALRLSEDDLAVLDSLHRGGA